MIVTGMFRNKGRTGYEIISVNTPDIIEYVKFDIYDYCWYWDSPHDFPHNKKNLGRWIRVAHRFRKSMVY